MEWRLPDLTKAADKPGHLLESPAGPTILIFSFDLVDIDGFPAGLTVKLNYLPMLVQLEVVSTPLFAADFDNDGDVDATDLSIWNGAYGANPLGDANGDNDSDGNDFLLWQQQVGSHPAVPAADVVPEPSGLVVLAAFAIGASGRRRIA